MQALNRFQASFHKRPSGVPPDALLYILARWHGDSYLHQTLGQYIRLEKIMAGKYIL